MSHARTEPELEAIIDSLFQKISEIAICPYYPVEDEYRVVMLNHKAEYVFRKERRFVIGDGVSTTEMLISLSGHRSYNRNGIVNDPAILNQIPSLGHKVYVTWKHNGSTLHRISTDSHDPLQVKIREVAARTSTALAMSFCCIDVIKVEAEDQPLVLEVNSDVWVEAEEAGYEDTKKTYTKVIAQLVEKRESCCTRMQKSFLDYLVARLKRPPKFLKLRFIDGIMSFFFRCIMSIFCLFFTCFALSFAAALCTRSSFNGFSYRLLFSGRWRWRAA